MQFVQNFPFMTILLTLICAVVTSVLDGRKARWLTGLMLVTVTAMTTAVMVMEKEPIFRYFLLSPALLFLLFMLFIQLPSDQFHLFFSMDCTVR